MKKIILLFSAMALLLAGCAGNPQPTSASLDELFLTRRSVRAYEAGRSISEAQVRELLTATGRTSSRANTMSPSARKNARPSWR